MGLGSAGAREWAADYQAGLAGNPAQAPSPTAAGWVEGQPSSDVSNFASAGLSPDGDSGYNGWRMLDNSSATSQFATWSRTLTAAQHSSAAARGWRLAARLRVADPVASNGGANSVVLLYGNNAAKRWVLFFDLNAAGQIVVTLVGGPTVVLAGVEAAWPHEHQLVYDAASGTASYWVDGVSKASGYAGTSGTFNGVQWGTGSSGGRGEGIWNSVSLVIEDPPAPSAPVARQHPISQSVAEGGRAVFSAAFSGSSLAYQWFHNTVAVAGGVGPTLALEPLAVQQGGDYWCRATGAGGSGSTESAALEVLRDSGGLDLTEFMAENDHGGRDGDGDQSDWIEIGNSASAPRSTAGWFLTDDPNLPTKWALPSMTLAPGGFLQVWASGKNRREAAGELHSNFSLNRAAGHYVALVRPDLSLARAYRYPEQWADCSFGRGAGQAGWDQFFLVASPGALNVDGRQRVKDGVVFGPPPGPFRGSAAVSAAVEPGEGVLRYATDGSLPSWESPAWSGPLLISASTLLRAAVIFPGERHGATATGAYLRVAADLEAFVSPLPLVVLSNHGAGAVPGISARGPNGDGSQVTAVALQAQSLAVLDAAEGPTALSSPVVQRSRAGLKVRGSSSFTFAEKSYSLETWGERDGAGRDVALLGMPEDSSWVLYGPDPAQFDNTLMHNSVAFALARLGGFPAPRYRFVELFLNSGGDLRLADHRGLALLLEKPSRGKERVDFAALSADGRQGGWMVGIDRMDALPAGSGLERGAPRHFHTAGPDRLLQSPDDNPRGFQGITTPGGAGSGSGVSPANDDQPNFYHSFFNFASPNGWGITGAQRAAVAGEMRAFDAALYGPSYTDPAAGYWPLIDAANWAQHLLLQTFTKNQDAIVLSSYLYRKEAGAPLRWATLWDFDRSFDKNISGGAEAAANLNWGHDRLFYRRMVTDPAFIQAYVDQWQDLRRERFSDAGLTAVVDGQAAEITAVVAARSGLSASAWSANLAAMKGWMVQRARAMDALYPAALVATHPGGAVPAGFRVGWSAGSGTTYYTTDGSDPRSHGGAVAGSAQVYRDLLAVDAPLRLLARRKVGSAWSGLWSGQYFPPQDLAALRITEVHYHPLSQGEPWVDGDEFEFIELQNTGAVALDLSGLAFVEGIGYSFPLGTALAPGAFYVVGRNPGVWAQRYPGVMPNGFYGDKLHNGGESLVLARGGEVVCRLSYGDGGSWRAEADGAGASLQRIAAAAPGEDAAAWTAAGPTPGAALSLADEDGDGMADYWEVLQGFRLGEADGAEDADGDGAANAAEYGAGTDPRDAASRFAWVGVEGSPGSWQFAAVAGRSYSLQVSADLATWEIVRQIPAGPVSRWEGLGDLPGGSRRYYRVVTPGVAP